MKAKLLRIWNTFKPEQKKKFMIAGGAIAFILLGLVLYKSTRGAAPPAAPPVAKKEISLGSNDRGALEKSLYNESTKVMTDMKKQMEDLQKELKDVKEAKAMQPEVPKPGSSAVPSDKGRPLPGVSSSTHPPLPSSPVPLPPGVPPAPSAATPSTPRAPVPVAVPVKPEVYGGIKLVSQQGDTKNDPKKKDGLKIYLPPSFMEATLLSGMYAPANEGGKGQPLPALIRIKNLAVLPNSVKADLKGCFVIAEAHGSLFDERAHVRLTTLSCLAKNGESVIDQKVKGYIVDQDGFVGLRGTVVSKMGAAVARSLFAGFIAGFGDAVAATSTVTTVSGVGVTQTLDTDKAFTAGLGKGISSAGHDLQRFLLELGKQAVPAIEVGAMRPVTIVISEGVDLEVKEKTNVCLGGTRCAQ